VQSSPAFALITTPVQRTGTDVTENRRRRGWLAGWTESQSASRWL